MIDRLIYVLVAAALASVFMFDANFAANLFRAVGEPLTATPLGLWETAIAALLCGLAAAALERWR